MEITKLLEKLSDIRDRVDIVRISVPISELDFVYDDLTEILEDYE